VNGLHASSGEGATEKPLDGERLPEGQARKGVTSLREGREHDIAISGVGKKNGWGKKGSAQKRPRMEEPERRPILEAEKCAKWDIRLLDKALEGICSERSYRGETV